MWIVGDVVQVKGRLGSGGWNGEEAELLEFMDNKWMRMKVWKIKIISRDYVSLNWYRESEFEPGTEAELALQVLGEDYFA